MLSFLKNLTLSDNEEVRKNATRATKDRNPKNADLRIFKDGSIYPSLEFASEFNLEYVKRDSEAVGNGFDIINSSEFSNTKAWDRSIILIAAVAKDQPKVDLFGTCTYDKETNEPVTSVLDQGSVTFGKESLIPMLKEVYGIEFSEDQKFVDLVVVRDTPFNTSSGIYFIPKKVVRGEAKGEIKIQRRENITLFPLVPAIALLEEDTTTAPSVEAINVAVTEFAEEVVSAVAEIVEEIPAGQPDESPFALAAAEEVAEDDDIFGIGTV